MKLPILVLNFKNYKEASNKKGLRLAKICNEVAKRFKITIAICPQYADLKEIAKKYKSILVFAQHIDPIESAGAFTGHIVAENLRNWISGTLLNHSEKRLSTNEIEKCIQIAKRYKLISVCCAKNVKEAKQIAKFSPDFIAIEPPELIGKGKAVSKAKPNVILQAIKAVRKINKRIKILCGAGISSGKDAEIAIKLGVSGILVSSAFIKAKKPKKLLVELVNGLRGVT